MSEETYIIPTNMDTCPFCGMPVKLKKFSDIPDCLYIVCPPDSPCQETGLGNAIFSKDGNFEKGIAAWNKRPATQPHQVTLDELMAAIINAGTQYDSWDALETLRDKFPNGIRFVKGGA